jgi:cell division protein FtsL
VVPVLIVGGILACAIVFGVLLEQVVLAQSAFRLTHINERVATAQAKHEELLLDAAKLESPGRIERVARTQLGMVDPPVVEYIVADVSPRNPPNRLAQTQDSEELPATGEAAATGPIEGEATP